MVGELPPGWVQIDFEQETPYGIFRDALVFPDGEVPPLEELEIMKQQRVDNWIAIVSNPPDPPPPPPEPVDPVITDLING